MREPKTSAHETLLIRYVWYVIEEVCAKVSVSKEKACDKERKLLLCHRLLYLVQTYSPK
ncbi:hypothetical protein PORCAN_668 [Porphyromonas crevioricanis JCM 13913]|nr:hypothetical protein PORCAN_668 [Porphyromonas crevioricanis JCM 13913]